MHFNSKKRFLRFQLSLAKAIKVQIYRSLNAQIVWQVRQKRAEKEQKSKKAKMVTLIAFSRDLPGSNWGPTGTADLTLVFCATRTNSAASVSGMHFYGS